MAFRIYEFVPVQSGRGMVCWLLTLLVRFFSLIIVYTADCMRLFPENYDAGSSGLSFVMMPHQTLETKPTPHPPKPRLAWKGNSKLFVYFEFLRFTQFMIPLRLKSWKKRKNLLSPFISDGNFPWQLWSVKIDCIHNDEAFGWFLHVTVNKFLLNIRSSQLSCAGRRSIFQLLRSRMCFSRNPEGCQAAVALVFCAFWELKKVKRIVFIWPVVSEITLDGSYFLKSILYWEDISEVQTWGSFGFLTD